jgi:D-alanyl-D-alanine carboxypeptidase
LRRFAAAFAVLALAGCGSSGPGTPKAATTPAPGAALDFGTADAPLAINLADPRDTVTYNPPNPPAAGVLFDTDTGQVLWRRNPTGKLPIASLTKMMTALVVDEKVPSGSFVPITKVALEYQGSAVGLLPKGKNIPLKTMLYGLMLPSGNDAARALAERAGGSIRGFVRMMNARAAKLGLRCTHYSSPDGFRDAHNYSCAADLAAEARAILRSPRLASVVRTGHVILPFPIKGRKLYLYNNNPLIRDHYPGVTGVKTGYTDAAGLCIVATATRGPVKLGVVLLHSPDWRGQAEALLDRGFAVAEP